MPMNKVNFFAMVRNIAWTVIAIVFLSSFFIFTRELPPPGSRHLDSILDIIYTFKNTFSTSSIALAASFVLKLGAIIDLFLRNPFMIVNIIIAGLAVYGALLTFIGAGQPLPANKSITDNPLVVHGLQMMALVASYFLGGAMNILGYKHVLSLAPTEGDTH